MTNSIRVIFATQYLENYGAHDWDGNGECPQRWKPKGGSTYIVSASAADIADSQWWDDVTSALTSNSDYSRQYVIDECVVDAIDFVESAFVADYEEPVYATVDGNTLICERESKSFFDLTPVAKRTWTQVAGGEMTDCTYVEYSNVA